ncbi:MAG: amidohydrolase family protein [Candidatus Omnitrophota bacterium]
MRNFLMQLCVALFSFIFINSAPAAEYIDVHTHLIAGEMPQGVGVPGGNKRGSDQRWTQPGQRGQSRKQSATKEEYEAAADNLVAVMDRLGLRQAIVMSPPKNYKNRGGPDDWGNFVQAVRRHPERLVLGDGGDSLNPIIQGTDAGSVDDEVYAKFERAVKQAVDNGAKCFGEMAVLHISYSDRHIFEQVFADHPLFFKLADYSAQYGLPIDLHMDCVPTDMATPALWTGMSSQNPSTLKANVPGLERLLAHNRDAKIVWQHVGRDTMCQLTPTLIRGLLNRHSNLYCAIWVGAAKMVTNTAGPGGINQIVDENYQIKPDWLSLFKDFPDRFVVGTDGFFASKPGKLDSSIESTWKFIDTLPAEIKDKISGANAKRIYRL